MLPIRKILHPTDFSECSDHAFRLACTLARDCNAPLIVQHVSTPFRAFDLAAALPPGYTEGLRAQLDHVDARDPQVQIERRLIEGDPATEIVRLAREAGCDLIVLGTHGRTGLRRVLIGSVAEQVVRKASCPVITIKIPVAPASAEPTVRTDAGISS
jgi:nucleotide-binding universal stress UspA family protein